MDSLEPVAPLFDERQQTRACGAAARDIQRGALGIEITSHAKLGAETSYPEHDWQADHRGTELLDAAVAGGRPDLRARLDRRADLSGQYAERYARAQKAEREGEEKPRVSKTEPRKTTGPPQRDVAAPVPVDRLGGRELQRDIYGRFGEPEDEVDTTERLKIYDLSPLAANPRKTERLPADLGFSVEYFSFDENREKGVKWLAPDLERRAATIASQRAVQVHGPDAPRCTRRSAPHGRRPSRGSIAQGLQAFELHLPPPQGPLVVLLEQDRAITAANSFG
jgi:hypothetical protein